MPLIINPGSGPVKGGTAEQARKNAQAWLDTIHNELGLRCVTMTLEHCQPPDGRYTFNFHHPVTGVTVQLKLDGLTEAEMEELLFRPRSYWNGSSCAEPQVKDWAADGYQHTVVFTKKA